MAPESGMVRVAALSDPHINKNSAGVFHQLFSQVASHADVLVICGDLTDHGLPDEAHVLARELAAVKVPVVGVLGNHDYESNRQDEVCKILADVGMTVLDGEACELCGVGFAGTKGFAGGFDQRSLAPWGEPSIKHFVREAIDEALKLESALATLRTRSKIALLHYSPIKATVEREPLEIYPFLGSSRLEEPLNRYPITAVFHGHAHHGTFEGKARSNVPVYNVSLPLLRHTFPDHPPFYVLRVPRDPGEGQDAAPESKIIVSGS